MITRPKVAAIPTTPRTPPRPESTTIAPPPAKTSAKVASASASARRASGGLDKQLSDEPPNADVDLVADRANRREPLPRRIVELPVLVALAGEDGARVATPHRDD